MDRRSAEYPLGLVSPYPLALFADHIDPDPPSQRCALGCAAARGLHATVVVSCQINKRPPSEAEIFFVVGMLRPVSALFGVESGTVLMLL